jgi:hypothetical protein
MVGKESGHSDFFIFHDLAKAPSRQFEIMFSEVYILPCQLILKSSLRMRRILAMLPCNDSLWDERFSMGAAQHVAGWPQESTSLGAKKRLDWLDRKLGQSGSGAFT